MIELSLSLIFAIVLTETLTELVVKSEIFEAPRNFVKSRSPWFGKLFSCGYCFSVWAALGVAFLLGLSYDLTGWPWVDLGLFGLIVHRLSNYLHNFNDKYLDKYYDIRFVNSEHPSSEEQRD
jgi:hypothetical protein